MATTNETMKVIANGIEQKNVSLGGVGVYKGRSQSMKLPVALSNALENHSEVKTIALHLDADFVGRNAAAAIAEQLRGRYEIRNEPPPVGKDCNDYLMHLRYLSQENR